MCVCVCVCVMVGKFIEALASSGGTGPAVRLKFPGAQSQSQSGILHALFLVLPAHRIGKVQRACQLSPGPGDSADSSPEKESTTSWHRTFAKVHMEGLHDLCYC